MRTHRIHPGRNPGKNTEFLNCQLPTSFKHTLLWIFQAFLAKFTLKSVSQQCRKGLPTFQDIVMNATNRTILTLFLIIDKDGLTTIELLFVLLCHTRTCQNSCSLQWMISVEQQEQNNR